MIIAGLVTLVLAAAVFTYRWHPLETATERAHRLCRQCGRTSDHVDWLIDAVRSSTLDRRESLQLHREQFDDPELADLCEPCAVAVLDAVAEPLGG